MNAADAARERLDPSLPGLGALGLGAVAEVLADELPADPRRELLAEGPGGYARLRLPLPGTPDTSGRLTGRPGPAGTGWIVLERWLAPSWRTLLAARFTRPPSASVGERRWNLLCHLRAAGVATAQPLAVGALGAGLASRRSFLVTSELEGYVDLPTWAREEQDPDLRERGLSALAAALARLVAARVELPRFAPADLALSRAALADLAGGTCENAAVRAPGGLTLNRLPSVVLCSVADARLRAAPRPDARRELAARLAACLGAEEVALLATPGAAPEPVPAPAG